MYGGQTSTQAGGERAGRRVRVERSDVDAIREAVPMVAAISPGNDDGGMTVVAAIVPKPRWCAPSTWVTGASATKAWETGRWLVPEDETGKQRVACWGGKAASKLFGENPAGGRRDHHQRPALHRDRGLEDQDAGCQLQHAG